MAKIKQNRENLKNKGGVETVSSKSKKKFKKSEKGKKKGINKKLESASTPVKRYFNNALKDVDSKKTGKGGPGWNKGGDGGKKKKFGGKWKKSGGGDSLQGVAAPPKPKSLKAKGKQSPVGNEGKKHKRKSTGDEKVNGSGINKKKRQKGGSDLEEQNMQKSEETKNRIEKFRKGKSRQGQVQKNVKMIVEPGGKWFENSEENSQNENTSVDPTSEIKQEKLSRDEVYGIHKSATTLFERDCLAYRNACLEGEQKSDFQWMEKMMKIGTLPDRMAAFVVKIQDSPVHNIHHLQNLISMVKVQSKQQCLMAADTLKDLFLEDLLPPERKLRTFDKWGAKLAGGNRVQMIKWIYEDRLKTCYSSFIEALRRMSSDNVDKIRAKAVRIIYQLLSAHPEKEAELLQMIVNKLGDPIKKVASRGLFYLNCLLQNHPRMKLVVIDEVERLLFRNNIAKRAQYYGICFLNLIFVEDEHPEVACKLINVYVAFFKGCVKTGDVDSKMMNALLTGLNKCYPSAKDYGFKFTENLDTLYKIIFLSNFNIGVQALSILFQLTDVQSTPEDADRYYRVLYRHLLRPEVATTSNNILLLNLLFRSLKFDNNVNRIMGFCKRVLQICQNVQPHLACAFLFMISEVSKSHAGILNVGNVPVDSVERNGESDSEEENIEEKEKNKEKILNLMKISNVKVGNNKNERIQQTDKPVAVENEENSSVHEDEIPQQITVVDLNTSGIICDDETSSNLDVKREYKHNLTEYDPSARNPSFCGAEFSLMYEIKTLTEHYHPSVSLFASTLLMRKQIAYEGNPMKDFTTARFLERFVYKNTKIIKQIPGAPRMYQPSGLRSIPVNSQNYLKQEEDKIPVEEKFFYRFFKETSDTKGNDDDESETESVGDDEFDELMANYFKSAKGKNLGDDDDFDENLDFAADIHTTPQGKKSRKGMQEDASDDEDNEMDDEGEESGEEFEADDADEMLDLDDDDDFEEEDGLEVFENDDDGDFEEVLAKKSKRSKKGIDMFAPAEQFAEMLEANADEGLAGPSTLINKDNADPKQLKWEMDRDRWVKGYKRNPKTKFGSKKAQKRRKK